MIGADDETQDMSCETEVPVVDSPATLQAAAL